jgi:prepilin-type N-terminal cleavage/methylation domain-containing protein
MRVFDPIKQSSREAGFTLIELLAVVVILAAVTSLSVLALLSIKGASMVDKAVSDLSGAVELARTFAMANHTYVRVGFSNVAVFPGNHTPSTIIITIYSVDGTLDADSSNDMADPSKWPMVGKAMVLNNLKANDELGSSSDDTPSSTNIAHLNRPIANLGTVSFNAFIQCNPKGETCVFTSGPSRYIKMGWDSATTQKNPFVIRLSGINGSISILRQENL